MITVPETTGGWKAETGRGTEAEEKDEWEESKAGSWETLQGQTLQQHNTIFTTKHSHPPQTDIPTMQHNLHTPTNRLTHTATHLRFLMIIKFMIK